MIARTRALRRARRDRPDSDAADAAAELFGVWWVTFDSIGLHRSAKSEPSEVVSAAPDPDVGPLELRRTIGALFARGLGTLRRLG